MKEWEPRFVGLLRNVLSCRRKDDVPMQLPETDKRHHDRCECAENGGRASRSLSHLGKHRNYELKTGAKGGPRDHENTTVHCQ